MYNRKTKTDELFEQAKTLSINLGYASPALFQRELKISYPEAATLVDKLEDESIVMPADGAKPRRLTEKYQTKPYPFNN